MSPHRRERFIELVSALPGTSLHEQWEALVAKVGGKVFCLLGNTDGDIVFKVDEIAFEGLTAMDGIGQAPYFAKGSWVRVGPDSLPADLLEAYIRQSHQLIASKLTRKLRLELGI